MNWRIGCAILTLFLPTLVLAQPPTSVTTLNVHPAPAPVPALRYRLLPDVRELSPGNAALYYHRAIELRGGFREDGLPERIDQWLAKPLSQLPKNEVREVVEHLANVLHEIELGARCRDCDWGLDDRGEGTQLLLPEIQSIRGLSPLVALKARLAMADGRLDAALHALQTGFQLARHSSQGAAFIQSLVGVAVATQMLREVEVFIQTPGAPNLYWALAELPRPLIDLTRAAQFERGLLLREFPELRDLENSTRTPEQIKRDLETGLLRLMRSQSNSSEWENRLALTALSVKLYPEAKAALLAQGYRAGQVESMPVLQVVLLHTMRQFETLRDDLFKWFSVPYWQAAGPMAKVDDAMRDATRRMEGMPFVYYLLPAIQRVYQVNTRVDRHVAALQCVELIRQHAAEHDGRLPSRLADATAAPAPSDPMTGQAFDYQVLEIRGRLHGVAPAGQQALPSNTLTYDIAIQR